MNDHTAWHGTGNVPEDIVRYSRMLRERYLADRYRPGYHFCVPEDWGRPGDPNGAFYANGRYHLMYLYRRQGSGFCWGHISSVDLMHWRHHPDAIGPGNGDAGCFSGGAFVDDDGNAYLTYWMLNEGMGDGTSETLGIGIAMSSDRHYDQWEKLEANPVIRSTDWGITETSDADGNPIIYGSADPSNIWKKDGIYYMTTGNLCVLNKFGRSEDSPGDMKGDWVDLFKSSNLTTWEYMHRFYARNTEWTDDSEDDMCPSFLPLPSSSDGGAGSGKHLQLFISHNKGCQYYIGEYQNDRFFPETHGRMTWADNTYFAPEALIDGNGRQIMWAWLTDNPENEEALRWSGVFGLPRNLWLSEDNTLRMEPVREIETLRCNKLSWSDKEITTGEYALDGVHGESCELRIISRSNGARRWGVKVRQSPNGEEETLLYYDSETDELIFDASKSGVTGRRIIERAPFTLPDGELLDLRIFIDKSVVEIYANTMQAICRRVFPGRDDSTMISLCALDGGAHFTGITAWEMMPSNPY